MKKLLVLGSLFISMASFSQSVNRVGTIDHGGNGNEITIGYTYSSNSRVVCFHIGMTRNGGGAATGIDCYSGNQPNSVTKQKLSSLTHADNNEITLFRISDNTNHVECYGNALTRVGNSLMDNNNSSVVTSAGADVSLKCQSI